MRYVQHTILAFFSLLWLQSAAAQNTLPFGGIAPQIEPPAADHTKVVIETVQPTPTMSQEELDAHIVAWAIVFRANMLRKQLKFEGTLRALLHARNRWDGDTCSGRFLGCARVHAVQAAHADLLEDRNRFHAHQQGQDPFASSVDIEALENDMERIRYDKEFYDFVVQDSIEMLEAGIVEIQKVIDPLLQAMYEGDNG